jgi:hypothetical protein
MGLVKVYQYRHDFTFTHLWGSDALYRAACQQMLVPMGAVGTPKVVNFTEQFG